VSNSYPEEFREWLGWLEEIADFVEERVPADPDLLEWLITRALDYAFAVQRMQAEHEGRLVPVSVNLLGLREAESELLADDHVRAAVGLHFLVDHELVRLVQEAPDELLAAIDRVGAVQRDPATFPHDPPIEFREAAVAVLDQIARFRYVADGGDLDELDELKALGFEDPDFVIDTGDLILFAAAFEATGDQPRYSACRAVAEWIAAQNERRRD
jgi:hypothetical protein